MPRPCADDSAPLLPTVLVAHGAPAPAAPAVERAVRCSSSAASPTPREALRIARSPAAARASPWPCAAARGGARPSRLVADAARPAAAADRAGSRLAGRSTTCSCGRGSSCDAATPRRAWRRRPAQRSQPVERRARALAALIDARGAIVASRRRRRHARWRSGRARPRPADGALRRQPRTHRRRRGPGAASSTALDAPRPRPRGVCQSRARPRRPAARVAAHLRRHASVPRHDGSSARQRRARPSCAASCRASASAGSSSAGQRAARARGLGRQRGGRHRASRRRGSDATALDGFVEHSPRGPAGRRRSARSTSHSGSGARRVGRRSPSARAPIAAIERPMRPYR